MTTLREYVFHEEPGITLYCGDARDVLALMEPSRCLNTSYCLEACDGACFREVALILTDPPYESEAHTQQRRVQREVVASGGPRAVYVEEIPFGPIDDALRGAVAAHAGRLARGWVLTFCQVEVSQTWRAAYEAYGLNYRRTCVWVKPDGMPQYSGDRPGMGYESLVAMHVAGRSEWNGGGRHDVFVHNKNSGGKHEHPTMKPEPLMRELVELFSDPGDLVLDPFAGSGTTLRACKDRSRRAIGIEIEPRYCEIAAKRLRQEVLFSTPAPAPSGSAP
jgi:site-specific DNA-methyltransferase (adenine-specific)